MNPQHCDACGGKRLKAEILAVTLESSSELRVASSDLGAAQKSSKRETRNTKRAVIPGLSIMDVCGLSVDQADEFFANLKLTEFQKKIGVEPVALLFSIAEMF